MGLEIPRTIYVQLERYLRSAQFRSRARTSQAEYTRVARHLQIEIGDVAAVGLTRDDIRELRDRWAVAGHRAATIRLQVLKNALEPLISDGVLPADLFLRLQRVHRPHGTPEQNQTWLDIEVELVINHCIQTSNYGLARTVALGRWAGLRRQTIITLLETDRKLEPGADGQPEHRLRCLSAKGEVVLDIPEDPRLTYILDVLTFPWGGDTVAYNRRGEQWKERQLNQALDRVLARLAEQGLVRGDLTLHGLRHSRGVELAESGCSDAELAAQLGHADAQTARVYRRQAATRRIADRAQKLVSQAQSLTGTGRLFSGVLPEAIEDESPSQPPKSETLESPVDSAQVSQNRIVNDKKVDAQFTEAVIAKMKENRRFMKSSRTEERERFFSEIRKRPADGPSKSNPDFIADVINYFSWAREPPQK